MDLLYTSCLPEGGAEHVCVQVEEGNGGCAQGQAAAAAC